MQHFELPAREETEESTRLVASMSAIYFKELISQNIPDELAQDLVCIFTDNLTHGMFTNINQENV